MHSELKLLRLDTPPIQNAILICGGLQLLTYQLGTQENSPNLGVSILSNELSLHGNKNSNHPHSNTTFHPPTQDWYQFYTLVG